MADIVFILGFGILIALAVNFLSDTLPYGEYARPCCHKCKAPIPILAYLSNKQCIRCQHRRSVRYFVIPLISLYLFSVIRFHEPGIGWVLAIYAIIYFLISAVIDWEHHIILSLLVVLGMVLGIIKAFYMFDYFTFLEGMAAGGILMGVTYLFGKLFVKIARVQREGVESGIGFGDVLMGLVVGASCGWPNTVPALMVGFILAGLISLMILFIKVITKKYKPFEGVGFAPFMAIGALLFLLF